MVLFVCSLGFVHAQVMNPLAMTETFKKTFVSETQKVSSFECDFVQIKHIAILSDQVLSKGICYFRRPDLISLQYVTPVAYSLIIVGNKMKMGENVMELKDNTQSGEMQSMISACLSGNLDLLVAKYDVSSFENALQYQFLIAPRANAANNGIKVLEMYLEKKDYSLTKLIIRETSEDFTEYVFSNKKYNISLSDALFSLR